MQFTIAALLVGSAAAFAPQQTVARTAVVVAGTGKYDGQLWDMAAKKDVWGAWDPSKPRADENFNPFERDPTGNAPDCSGYFPGEGKYKDPARPDVNFASMMAEKAVMAEIESNKKAGDVPGAPGCLNKSL